MDRNASITERHAETTSTTDTEPAPAKRATGRPRGRPKGSRNRPKAADLAPLVKAAAQRIPTAARYLDISASMVRKLIKQRKLETVSIGRSRLVLTRSLDHLLGIDDS
jgi:excisionase family DNA binding protein